MASTTPAAAGVAHGDLYLAWDFTVATRRSITERLLFMRDDAAGTLGPRSGRPARFLAKAEAGV